MKTGGEGGSNASCNRRRLKLEWALVSNLAGRNGKDPPADWPGSYIDPPWPNKVFTFFSCLACTDFGPQYILSFTLYNKYVI